MTFPRRALFLTILLRLICSGFAWRFGQAVSPNLALAAKNQLTTHLLAGPRDGWRYLLYGIWERFDTLWYLSIAANGYDRPAAIVFYPLYPFLIRCVSALGVEPVVAALSVSTVACFFMFWGFQKLAALDWPGRELYALILFAAFPSSFIFLAAYPESLLIALAIWSIYFARTGRWWLAGTLACAASGTKAAGLMAGIPLLVILWQQRKWHRWPAVALAPVGFLAFTLWLKLAGFPASHVIYAEYWHTQVAPPWKTLFDALAVVVKQADWLIALNVAAVVFCIAIITLSKAYRLDYLLFSVACLILFLTKYTEPLLQSTPRYILLVFPVFLYSASRIQSRTTLWFILIGLCPIYFGMLRTFLWWGLIV
jgi:hypothetical protein